MKDNFDDIMEFLTAKSLDSIIGEKIRGECYNTEASSQ